MNPMTKILVALPGALFASACGSGDSCHCQSGYAYCGNPGGGIGAGKCRPTDTHITVRATASAPTPRSLPVQQQKLFVTTPTPGDRPQPSGLSIPSSQRLFARPE